MRGEFEFGFEGSLTVNIGCNVCFAEIVAMDTAESLGELVMTVVELYNCTVDVRCLEGKESQSLCKCKVSGACPRDQGWRTQNRGTISPQDLVLCDLSYILLRYL